MVTVVDEDGVSMTLVESLEKDRVKRVAEAEAARVAGRLQVGPVWVDGLDNVKTAHICFPVYDLFGGGYEVPISQLTSPGEFADWMAHLCEKDWFDAEMAGGMIMALKEYCRLFLMPNNCPFEGTVGQLTQAYRSN